MGQTEKREVVIVGAGLVGSLLATIMNERGHDVTVYESRPDFRFAAQQGGRSINLVLTRRGIRALELAGLAAGALELTVPVLGRMMHSLDGELAYQQYGRDDSECNSSISRAGLNDFLINAAEQRGVRFRFGAKLVGADILSNRLFFRREDDDDFDVLAEVVFGADGVASTLRRAMVELSGFDERIEMLEHGYKELLIPAGAGGEFQIEKSALHIWPRGRLMLMALPNLDGSFTATLYLPFKGRDGFNELATTEAVLDLFLAEFPDAIPLIPDLADSFFSNPTGELGTVRLSPWNHENQLLLLGDASHGVVPFFGQGMNSGFEDCTILCRMLDEYHGSRARAFPEFSRQRSVDLNALADMALENFGEMRDRVGDEAFLFRKRVEHRLESEIPLEYRSRYSMVMYSHIPFDIAGQVGRIQEKILDELCAGLDSVDELDLERARRLVRERLTPFLDSRGVDLDY